jgi:hypothetical protein
MSLLLSLLYAYLNPMIRCGHKRRRPRLNESGAHRFEQPSPEACSQLIYVLACKLGMAPTGDGVARKFQREQRVLNLVEYNECGAFFVVLNHMVDP